MYKLTQLDGTDFYSGTINYAENIGKIIRVKDYDGPEFGVCGKGIHASRNPNDCFIEAKIPCRAFRVQGIQRIVGNKKKSQYQAVKVLEEITDLDKLFGWKYSEAINPIHPFMIKSPKITDEHIKLLEKWTSVWDWSMYSVVASVRDLVRNLVVASVRASVGGNSIVVSVRASARDLVRASIWNTVWAYVGSIFPNIKKWKYVKHKLGEYPFQPAVDLWKQGFVPSFDGKTWRLHACKKSKVLWEGEI